MGELEASGKKVIKFSITGYSLGGLVSRYVIGSVHSSQVASLNLIDIFDLSEFFISVASSKR